jgi:hypothetical protein
MSQHIEEQTATTQTVNPDAGVKRYEHTHRYKVDEQYEKRDSWRDFIHHSWKPMLATIYGAICVFDFIIAPSWIGITRKSSEYKNFVESLQGLDPQAQMQLINMYEQLYRWNAVSLEYGGIFHLSFGAILTGVALTGYRGGIGSKPPIG